MQNKHQKKFFLLSGSQPPGRGGGQAGWSKRPSLSKEIFLGLPLVLYTKNIKKSVSFKTAFCVGGA